MLNGTEIANLLRERGFTHIYHANTVATALSYLRNGGLLSRQYVEDHPQTCFQTMQRSDEKDKMLGIYNDIFFDATNMWQVNQVNYSYYGPVVFKYTIDFLSQMPNVFVSKNNPIHMQWNCVEDNFFCDVQELKTNLEESTYSWPIAYHIILKNQGGIDFTALHEIDFFIPNFNYEYVDSEKYIQIINDGQKCMRCRCEEQNIYLNCKTMYPDQWNKLVGEENSMRFYATY